MAHEYPDLHEFLASLSTTDHFALTDNDVERIRLYIRSDGCTGVPDFYFAECVKHDFYYRTHVGFDGKVIKKSEGDCRFRQGIQRKSKLGFFSPMAWWRWLGVQGRLGHKAWRGES